MVAGGVVDSYHQLGGAPRGEEETREEVGIRRRSSRRCGGGGETRLGTGGASGCFFFNYALGSLFGSTP